MFKVMGFDPTYDVFAKTVEEAEDWAKNWNFYDYVVVVEVKKVLKINRNIEETTIEQAKKEEVEKDGIDS